MAYLDFICHNWCTSKTGFSRVKFDCLSIENKWRYLDLHLREHQRFLSTNVG